MPELCVFSLFFSHYRDVSTHVHQAQPVSVLMPPIIEHETSSVVTKYETEMHMTNTAKGDCDEPQ